MKHKRNMSMVPAAIIGLLVSIVVSVLCIVVVSWLIQKEVFSENIEVWMLIPIWSVSTICGAAIGGLLSPDNRMILQGLVSLGYIALLCGTGIMVFHEGFYRFGIGIIIVLLSCAVLFGMHFIRNKKPASKKRYKYH